MKIDRFIVALTSSDKFIELQPDPEGSLCFASEVAKLEASHAQLLEALHDAIALYGKFGAIVNDPHNPGEWITKAQQAVRRATE